MRDEDYARIIERLQYLNGNLVDVIAAERGWTPLEQYEEMTIHIGNKTYIIVRLADVEDD